jgi:hypothetical protein
MTKASKQKFKEAKKKLKASLITGISGILNKADAGIQAKIKKSVEDAASKIAKEFTRKAKKNEAKTIKGKLEAKSKVSDSKKTPAKKASRPAAKRKPVAKRKVSIHG